MSEVASTAPERALHLDGLRFFAFFSVFLHHALKIPMLWAGVDVFFVISGYLITGILLKSREKPNYFSTFYKRRFLRIFPPYYLFITIVFLFFEKSNFETIFYYFTYLSNFNDAFHYSGTVNSLTPMWSLAIEEQFYLIWPLFIWALGRKGIVWMSITLLLLAPALRFAVAIYADNHWPAYFLLPCRADLLAAGSLLAVVQMTVTDTQFLKISAQAAAVAVGSAILFVATALFNDDFRTGTNSVLFNTLGYSLVMLIATGLVAYLVPRNNSIFSRILKFRVFVYLGSISYVLYLVHKLVLIQVSSLGLSTWLYVLASFTITMLIAMCSWRFLEAPLQRYKSKIAAY
ncbi:MAG: acyltransferase [Arenimonas sp.]